jgi:hypothetical protein
LWLIINQIDGFLIALACALIGLSNAPVLQKGVVEGCRGEGTVSPAYFGCFLINSIKK